MTRATGFVGLHVHTDGSLLDGASQLEKLVKRAAEQQMPALAVTDHGVMYGAIDLIQYCGKNGIKPIVGNEMYIINGDIVERSNLPRYHQIVLAKNRKGYENLVKLTTISHLQGFYRKPRINKDLLKEHSEGLIVTSACMAGEIPQAILQGKPDVARRVAQWYKDVFGDDFYLEIQDHGMPSDRTINLGLLEISRELGIKLVATNDSHYVCEEEVSAHDALLCIQTGMKIEDEKRLRYTGTEWLKSLDEMRMLFRDHLPPEVVEEALANTLEIAAKVEDYKLLPAEPMLPEYPVPEGYTAESYLRELTVSGLCERMDWTPETIPQEYKERLEYELQIITQMQFPDYFLVVWDYIKFARDNNIPTGPGRGSAAGSIVAFGLRITNIDPILHGLMFERFLNPARISMPDVDTDFCIERRGEVIEYVTRKYGQDHVAQIATFSRMTSKAVLKDVGRVMNLPYAQCDYMSKLIPVVRGKPAKLKDMIGDRSPSLEFKDAYLTDPVVKNWVDMAIAIEGMKKSLSVHAAGVVISAIKLDKIVPLQRSKEGHVITMYDMEIVEKLGLLKMDFLGLKNLTMIQMTIESIAAQGRTPPDLERVNMKDPKTYQLLSAGGVDGVFQIESGGMRQVVKELKPTDIGDISSVLALYRPGPLDAGMIPEYITGKHGSRVVRYDDPRMEPILSETYGTLVYQEQIMKIAQDMAGYSLAEADIMRKAIGKKKKEDLDAQRGKFIEGCVTNGFPRQKAEELWQKIEGFADYCFNKAHSMAYAHLSYQTAYLKANYPVEYMAALLSANSGSKEDVQKYIATCLSMGIPVDAPDVNQSGRRFTPAKNRILFGLVAVQHVGETAVEHILQVRSEGGPFQSFADFCNRVSLKTVNKKTLEALIKCGAFDSLTPNRKQLVDSMERMIKWANGKTKDEAVGQISMFDLLDEIEGSNSTLSSAPPLIDTSDYESIERLGFEKELLGFYVSDHPLRKLTIESRLLAPINLADAAEYQVGSWVSAVVMVSQVKHIMTKKNEPMAFMDLEDISGKIGAVVFPSVYQNIQKLLKPDSRFIVWATTAVRNDEPQLQIIHATSIERTRILQIKLSVEQAEDIQCFDIIREILVRYNPKEMPGRTPTVIAIGDGHSERYVRLGQQFCVNDAEDAAIKLCRAGFEAEAIALFAKV